MVHFAAAMASATPARRRVSIASTCLYVSNARDASARRPTAPDMMPPRRARPLRATLPQASPDSVPRASSLARDRPRAERPRPDPRRTHADPRVRTALPATRVHYSSEYTLERTRTFSMIRSTESEPSEQGWYPKAGIPLVLFKNAGLCSCLVGEISSGLDPRFDLRVNERTCTRLSRSILSGRTATRSDEKWRWRELFPDNPAHRIKNRCAMCVPIRILDARGKGT